MTRSENENVYLARKTNIEILSDNELPSHAPIRPQNPHERKSKAHIPVKNEVRGKCGFSQIKQRRCGKILPQRVWKWYTSVVKGKFRSWGYRRREFKMWGED
jgi:hypothetical protein